MKFIPEGPIPKNVRITADWIDKRRDQITESLADFIHKPDVFLDLITPPGHHFKLFFYQRIFLRVCIRYRYVYCVAPRAFSKSFVAILAGILRCIFLPGEKFFICAPGKEQGAKIAQEKINEILGHYPLLEKEILKYNKGKDYTTLVFKNGSVFDIVGALDSTRGGRRNGGIVDEVRDHDGDLLAEVVLPLMNVDRRTTSGEIDVDEPNQQQIYITSASNKGSYAYEKLIELLIQEILNPKSTFIWGVDYRVPMMHGLLNKSYIEDMKLSSTYKEDIFAREYLGLWTGGSDESWIDYDKMTKYRTIVNAESKRRSSVNPETFYYIAVDVARIGVLTSVQIFKVTPKEDYFLKQLVNSVSFHDMHFELQAIEIKKLNNYYQPKEICIDGTGLGVGLMDFMVKEQIDNHGIYYPPLASWNDDEYKKFPGDKVIYVLKANSSENSEIHSNCFAQIQNGHCRFLLKEQEAKSKLLATAVGQKMPPLKRLKKLTPYMETTKLFEEICNLRVKQNQGNLMVERINLKINKDRFSAFEYGLWRIKSFEDKYTKKRKRKARSFKDYVFFSKGGR